VKPSGVFSFDLEESIPVTIGNVALDPDPFNKPAQKSGKSGQRFKNIHFRILSLLNSISGLPGK
jgi:hypothetical protein